MTLEGTIKETQRRANVLGRSYHIYKHATMLNIHIWRSVSEEPPRPIEAWPRIMTIHPEPKP